MITLTSFQQDFINRNRNQSDFKVIKNVIKALRDNGLDTPKLNVKKDTLMTFWQELLEVSASYQASNSTVETNLFSNQLDNVGDRSRKSLMAKLR